MDLTLKILGLLYKCLIAFALVCTLVFSGSMGASYFNLKSLQTNWLATKAQITKIDIQHGFDGTDQYRIFFSYNANNETIYKNNLVSEKPSFNQGDMIDILVNPENISQAINTIDNEVKLYSFYTIIGLVFSFILALILIPKSIFKGFLSPLKTKNQGTQ